MSESGVDDFTQLLIRFLFASIPLTPFMVAGYKGKRGKELLSTAMEIGTILAFGYLLQAGAFIRPLLGSFSLKPSQKVLTEN